MNLTNTIGWTLVHFVWQGAAIAGLLGAVRYGLRNRSAQARYTAAMAAMLLMLASVGATFAYLDSGNEPTLSHPQPSGSSMADPPALLFRERSTTSSSWRTRMPDYFPVLVYIWIAGVLALSIRSLGGWVVTQHLETPQCSDCGGVLAGKPGSTRQAPGHFTESTPLGIRYCTHARGDRLDPPRGIVARECNLRPRAQPD